MEKNELIKDSVKRILGTAVMILVFTIGLLALQLSLVLVGHQEELKTSEDEFIIYQDELDEQEESSITDGAVVVLNDDSLSVQVVKPLTPTEGVKGQ